MIQRAVLLYDNNISFHLTYININGCHKIHLLEILKFCYGVGHGIKLGAGLKIANTF